MYKNIIFDADGTLLDTLPGICEGFNYVMDQLGLKRLSEQAVKPFMGPSLMETFTQKLKFSLDQAEIAVRHYRDFYWEKGFRMCEFYQGVPELLNRLKSDGKLLSVATNKPQVFIDMILKEKGYYDCFTVIAGADVSETSTDKTQLVQRATLSQSAVMVGDRYVDITAANNAGVDSIGVLWGAAEDGEFIQYPPTHIAKTPDDVYLIVNRK